MSAPAKSAEAQAYLELIKRKPPANVDGLLSFVADLRKNRYSEAEQRSMAETNTGKHLANAVRKCEGLRRQFQEQVSAVKDQNGNTNTDRQVHNPRSAAAANQRKSLQEASFKYLDCLAYVSCTDSWKEYTQCWASISNIPMAQLQDLLQHANYLGNGRNGLEMLCHQERHQLERCVGNLVSGTVRNAWEGDGCDSFWTDDGEPTS